jgi:hypothetical protein
LNRSQIEEVPNRFNLHFSQGSVQANHAVLEDIISLFPPSQSWKSTKHGAGQAQEPIAGVSQ